MNQLLSMSPEELSAFITSLGAPAYRARQLFSELHKRKNFSIPDMTVLPKDLRETLCERFSEPMPKLVLEQESAGSRTAKYLFELYDGERVEGVLMEYRYGLSMCLSTQVGCKMGCRFCASTLNGCVRSLSAGEILGMYYVAEQKVGEIGHIVLMGSGEPFDNYNQVMRFLTLVHDEQGRNLSYRNITLSTCGLVPKMREFTDAGLPITLAVSLHAPNDTIRNQLMPISKRYSMAELMDACGYYIQQSGHRLSFEYALMEGFNAAPENAKELVKLLSCLPAGMYHVNLIPVNPVEECKTLRPSAAAVREFMTVLENSHVPVTLRRELAADIDGACGQLRRRFS